VRRAVTLGDEGIAVRDEGLPGPSTSLRLTGRDEVRRHFAPPVPIALGYGRLARGAA
jgi:hypothetical protein